MDIYKGKVAEGPDKKKIIKFAVDVNLDKCLGEREVLGYLTIGRSSDRDVLIVVTNKRVFIFYRSAIIKVIEKVELPIGHIISYVKDSGIVLDTIFISTADKKYKIGYVEKESASEFIKCLGMSINKNSDVSYSHSEGQDIISSLERLSSLLEKGYMTREEFNLEKFKLLSSNNMAEPVFNEKANRDKDVFLVNEDFNNENVTIFSTDDHIEDNSEEDSKPKNEIKDGAPSLSASKITGWFFGIILIIIGLSISDKSVISAIMIYMASMLLLPVFRDIIYDITRIQIMPSHRFFTVTGLFLVALYFLPSNSTDGKENKQNDPVITPDSALRNDAYQLISQSVEGALVFEGVKKTISDPLSYVVYFKTNVPAMLSQEGAVFLENEAYFRNLGRTEAWQVIYCRDEVMRIKEKHNIFMLSAHLLDYSGKRQSIAVCN